MKEKEASGEFTPKGHIDALHKTLGGVRLGLRKVYGDQYTTTTKSSVSSLNSPAVDVEYIKAVIQEELREEMTQNFNAILEQMGLRTLPCRREVVSLSLIRPMIR